MIAFARQSPPPLAPGRESVGVLQLAIALAPGGTERLIVETVRRLRNRHRMTVCCLDAPGAWGEDLQREGVSVQTLSRRPGFRPQLGREIARIVEAAGAQVVHCHHYTPFVYGCIARFFRPELRLIFTEHGRLSDGPPSRKRRLANRLLAPIPDRVYTVSADLRAHLVSEGFRKQDVEVVANGIDPGSRPRREDRDRARTALNLPPSTFVVGSVGRLDRVKDLPTLIRAFSRNLALRPTSKLVIVGEGPLRGDLESLVASLGIGQAVSFVGHHPDVPELMPAFDAYVSSSTFEGVSLTILEAMAAALPVIATRVGGTPEVVVDSVSGWLVPAQDPTAMAERLEYVASHPTESAAVGLAGRTRVCERFSLDRMIASYALAYEQLAVPPVLRTAKG